jgi:hypothetical protein
MKEIIEEERNVEVVIKQSEHETARILGGAHRVLTPPAPSARQVVQI